MPNFDNAKFIEEGHTNNGNLVSIRAVACTRKNEAAEVGVQHC
jgi:hypothetical protein